MVDVSVMRAKGIVMGARRSVIDETRLVCRGAAIVLIPWGPAALCLSPSHKRRAPTSRNEVFAEGDAGEAPSEARRGHAVPHITAGAGPRKGTGPWMAGV
jgi:hypothetical protein